MIGWRCLIGRYESYANGPPELRVMRPMSSQSILQSLARSWLPLELNDVESESFWRARLILSASALLSLLCLFSATLQTIRGSQGATAIALALFLFLTLVPVSLRYTGSVLVAGNTLVAGLFIALSVVNISSLGHSTGATLTFPLVAALGFLCPGRLWPSVWAVVVAAELVAIPFLPALPFAPIIEPNPDVARQAIERVPLLLTCFALLAGLAADRILKDGQQRKRDARLELEALNVEKEELQQSILDRQKNLASIGTLAASVAHQINNPVGAILAASQFAIITKNDADYETVSNEAFETIAKEAKRCGQIVHSLLRISTGQRSEIWEEDLHAVVEGAYTASIPYANECSAELLVELAAEATRVKTSPIELEQALVNLVRNAIESREEGARVLIRTIAETDSVRIQVEDNGNGVDESVAASLLDPFFTTKQSSGGTGLGLSVARGIIGDHGGELQFFPVTNGQGTIFEVELPRTSSVADIAHS